MTASDETLPAGVAALMERYVGGDPAAYRALQAELIPRLRRMMRRFVADEPTLDDVIQMTMLKAHLARERFVPSATDPDGSVRAWYYTIARRAALDLARKTTRQRSRTADVEQVGGLDQALADRAADIEASIEEEEEAREIIARVRDAVSQLPDSQRAVVEMHKLQGMSMAEVASRLSIQEGAARVRAHRAYKALARLLGGGVAVLVVLGAGTMALMTVLDGGKA